MSFKKCCGRFGASENAKRVRQRVATPSNIYFWKLRSNVNTMLLGQDRFLLYKCFCLATFLGLPDNFNGASRCFITPTNEVSCVLCDSGKSFFCAVRYVTSRFCGWRGAPGAALWRVGGGRGNHSSMYPTASPPAIIWRSFATSYRFNYWVLTKVHYIKVVPLLILGRLRLFFKKKLFTYFFCKPWVRV